MRYVLAPVAEFQMCLVATAWSECNVIPGGSPALFPKLLTLCFLQKPADTQVTLGSRIEENPTLKIENVL